MRIRLIELATLLGLAGPAWADWRNEINAGNAASKGGDLDAAIAQFTEAIQLKPDDADAYYTRGIAYEKLGQRDKAIADYRLELSLAPNMKSAQDGLKRLGTN